MFNRTTDGSNDNEAVKIVNALKPFWKKWTKEWGRSCVRSKKMTVSTAPSLADGVIGVTDAFSDTECMIPFKMDVANAVVGDTVWVKWLYDNQQTMYAESMGDIRAELTTLSGVETARTVSSGSSSTINVIFEKPFKQTPVVVATMTSAQTVGTDLCSVRVWNISTTGFTIGIQNGSSYDRTLGATWIATGTLSEGTNVVVVQNQSTNELFIY
ncbi:MAG: H-type lectin domain-containing protein [Clostridiales bacterium]|nr:H-type lectin domain-containing protein [Clostridiales bacterium]